MRSGFFHPTRSATPAASEPSCSPGNESWEPHLTAALNALQLVEPSGEQQGNASLLYSLLHSQRAQFALLHLFCVAYKQIAAAMGFQRPKTDNDTWLTGSCMRLAKPLSSRPSPQLLAATVTQALGGIRGESELPDGWKKKPWLLMRRIVAALSGALCGMPLATAQPPAVGSDATSAANSRGPAASTTSWVAHVGRVLEDPQLLEQAQLAGAVFGVAGDCALAVSTWWDRAEAAPGFTGVPKALVHSLSLDLHAMAHALAFLGPYHHKMMGELMVMLDITGPRLFFLVPPASLKPPDTGNKGSKKKRGAGTEAGSGSSRAGSSTGISNTPAHINDVIDNRGLLAGHMSVIWKIVTENAASARIELENRLESLLLLTARLLQPLHANQPRPITDPAPYLSLPRVSLHTNQPSSSTSKATGISSLQGDTQVVSDHSEASRDASAALSDNSRYFQGSVWAPTTFGLGPANAALTGVAALRASRTTLPNGCSKYPPSSEELLGYIGFSDALSAVGHAMMKEASEPGFVDRMAADMAAICSWATTCGAMCEAANLELEVLATVVGAQAGPPWQVNEMPDQLENHTQSEKDAVNLKFTPPVAVKPDAARLIQPAAAVAARLAHAGLVCCRMLGQLIQDPRIAASLVITAKSSIRNASTNAAAATPPSSSSSAGGGQGVHEAVVVAAHMAVQLYRSLLKYGQNICGLSLMLAGVLPNKFPLTAAQKRAATDALNLLPPEFDRCCLSVCSWAGGLHALWPLVTASLDMLKSPSYFLPGQPFAPPWVKSFPELWVKHMLWTISGIPCHLMALLSYICIGDPPPAVGVTEGQSSSGQSTLTSANTAVTAGEGQPSSTQSRQTSANNESQPRSITAWLGKGWVLPGGVAVPPQALVYRLGSLPAAVYPSLHSRDWADGSRSPTAKGVHSINALLQFALPLLSLIHLAADAHAAAAGGAKREGPETIGVGGVPVDTSMFRTLDAVVERMLGGSSTTSSSSATSKEQSREYRTSGTGGGPPGSSATAAATTSAAHGSKDASAGGHASGGRDQAATKVLLKSGSTQGAAAAQSDQGQGSGAGDSQQQQVQHTSMYTSSQGGASKAGCGGQQQAQQTVREASRRLPTSEELTDPLGPSSSNVFGYLHGCCLGSGEAMVCRQLVLEAMERITMALWAYDTELYYGPSLEMLAKTRAAAMKEPLYALLAAQEATWGPLAWGSDQKDEKSEGGTSDVTSGKKSEGGVPGVTRDEDLKAQALLAGRVNASVETAGRGRPDIQDLLQQALGQPRSTTRRQGKK